MKLKTAVEEVAAFEQPRKGVNEAYLVDVAELGAALGSGDMELAQQIDAKFGNWLDARNTPLSGQGASQCLVELLEGGALANPNLQGYVDAFSLICRQLGESLPVEYRDSIHASMLEDLPLDIPSAPTSTVVNWISKAPAADLMGDRSAGQTIITFTH